MNKMKLLMMNIQRATNQINLLLNYTSVHTKKQTCIIDEQYNVVNSNSTGKLCIDY